MEIRKPSFLDGAEDPGPEPVERNMRVLKLSEGFRVTAVGIRLSAVTDSCRLSLFVAVNNLEHPDGTFNSVQVIQSTSKLSSYLPCFQDLKSYYLSVFN